MTRTGSPAIEVISRAEVGRFPPTPHPFLIVDGEAAEDPRVRTEYNRVAAMLRAEVNRRMTQSGHYEVQLFVHGFNNSFDWAAASLAELWHFLGRRGAPVLYSWPAAHGGLMGYFVDRESGEFTVYTTDADKALSLSQTLMSGTRLGRIRVTDLGEQERAIFEVVDNVAFVDVQGVKSLTGHAYYLGNPSTSSDIIRVITAGERPGEPGRPLNHRMLNFWEMPVEYPVSAN